MSEEIKDTNEQSSSIHDVADSVTESHPQTALVEETKSSSLSVDELLEYGFKNLELDDDSFSKLFDKEIKDIKEDELVQGTIVDINKDEIKIDIGFKSIGVVPRSELLNADNYKIGDSVDVFLLKKLKM